MTITKASNAILTITDGTVANTVSLLVSTEGAHLNDWSPKGPAPATVIWASSPYQDGKHLVSKTYDNIVDTFGVIITSGDQDAVIHDLRQFLILLERGIEYWTDEYSTNKYWLEVRGSCETNIRYAFVVDYTPPEIPNPYDKPFIGDDGGKATLDEISLIIEHTIWSDSLIIGADCVEITAGRSVAVGGLNSADFSPVNSNDDAFITSGGGFSDNTGLLFGKSVSPSYTMTSGIRFVNVTIPAGSHIESAYITFHNTELATPGIRCNIRIRGEDNAHPAVFTGFAEFMARVGTGLAVLWSNIPVPSVVDYYDTPDFKGIVQEIIDLPGWASGHNLVIFLQDHASDAGAFRYGNDTDDGDEAVLHVVWSSGTPILHGSMKASCNRGPAVANFWNGMSLSHAFWHDDSTGTFSNNLVDISMADDTLLPPTPAVGDRLMCCIEDHGVNLPSTPFTSLVIDLHSLSADITSVDEWLSDGIGGWIASTFLYNPNCPLLPTGVIGKNFITWPSNALWAQDTYNGVTGFWISFRVAAVGAAPTPPEKENSYPLYSVMWPNIVIGDDELHGDIRAIIDFLLSVTHGPGYTNLMISARKVSRTNGEMFTPYIALNSKQLSTHLRPLAVGATETPNSLAYTGRDFNWTVAGTTAHTWLAYIRMDMRTYAGRFRVFLRTHVTTGAADVIGLHLAVSGFISGTYETPVVWNTGTGDQIFDFGIMSFSSDAVLGSGINWIDLHIHGLTTAAANIDLYDLVFVPVDDACMELIRDDGAVATTDMDEPIKAITSDYKQGPYSAVLYNNTSAGFFVIDWTYPLHMLLKTDILGSFGLAPDEEYWIMFFIYDAFMAATESYFQYLIAPVLDKTQRYLLARGDE